MPDRDASGMRFLFATDGSRGAGIAEDFLLSLPLSCADEVTIVTAPTASERDAYALLARCRWRFAARDVHTATTMRGGGAADVADATAIERGAELIVVGSRGLGQITGALMGSVARTLARGAATSVLVVRARRDAPRHVLLAIDGSPEGRAAIDLLACLPLPSEARVTQLHVVTPDADDRVDEVVMEHARVTLAHRVFDHDVVDRGHIGEEVLHRALSRSSDLIVLGTRGQTAGSGILRTSTADHVLSHAPCAVLVAKMPLAARQVEAPTRAVAIPAF